MKYNCGQIYGGYFRSKKSGGGYPRFKDLILKDLDLGLTQNAINSGAAYRALALRHTTTRVRDVHSSFELALLFALYAVGLTLICLSHNFLRFSQVCPVYDLNIPPRHAQVAVIHAPNRSFLA